METPVERRPRTVTVESPLPPDMAQLLAEFVKIREKSVKALPKFCVKPCFGPGRVYNKI